MTHTPRGRETKQSMIGYKLRHQELCCSLKMFLITPIRASAEDIVPIIFKH